MGLVDSYLSTLTLYYILITIILHTYQPGHS